MLRLICPIVTPVLLAAICIPAVAETQKKVVVTVETSQNSPSDSAKPPFSGKRASVDVALLLDTSNSMDGLINQAKSQLWTIVQQFAKAKKEGQTPVLRVALFEYGNTGLPATEGYLRQVVQLTDNLDELSEALFSLTTSGGDEYCGQVIDEAITRLAWSEEPNGYKAIFIAGNEPFTQGSVNYRDACKRAIEKGIVVNTIHCGRREEGIRGKWQDGARIAEGDFFNIDQDRAVVQIKCPQDEIIIRLNAELNKTYLWYGSPERRRSYSESQVAQDSNAQTASPAVAASRGITKSGALYRNVNRDLVDTLQENESILQEVEEKHLPEPLQELEPDERKAYVERMASKRKELQKKIKALAAEREAYLAKERRRQADESGSATLGDAVSQAVQKQLVAAGFEMEKE